MQKLEALKPGRQLLSVLVALLISTVVLAKPFEIHSMKPFLKPGETQVIVADIPELYHWASVKSLQ